MSRVEEFEQALEELTDAEFAQVARRVVELDQARWDVQLDSDAQSGNLDFLIEEARVERLWERLRPWPDES